jgi:hypothetical protein
MMEGHERFAIGVAVVVAIGAVAGCGNSTDAPLVTTVDAAAETSHPTDANQLDAADSTTADVNIFGDDGSSTLGDSAGMDGSGGDAMEAATLEPAEAGDDGGGSDAANRQTDGALADASDAGGGGPSDANSASDAPAGPNPDGGPALAPTDCPLDRVSVWGAGLKPSDWLAAAAGGAIDYGAANATPATDPMMGPILQVQFPVGSDSTQTTNPAGVEFRITLPIALSSALITYWIKYEDGFDMSLPLKFPGLCGGPCPGAKVAGGATTGWSVRPRSYYGMGTSGQGEMYAYVVPVPTRSAYRLGTGTWTWTTGGWHRVIQLMVMNTGSNTNGILRMWYDVPTSSPPTYENTAITYATDGTNIQTLLFSMLWVNNPTPTQVQSHLDLARIEVCQ